MLRKKLKLAEQATKNNNNEDSTSTSVSPYFCKAKEASNNLLKLDIQLSNQLNLLNFEDENIRYVYNPLDYAFTGYSQFVKKYFNGPKSLLFVGMNPGPYGMCQTGIPFGDVNSVRSWFNLNFEVSKPEKECPMKPVLGLNCTRVEQSGKRFWGYFERKFGQPENFFKNALLINYCPIAFLNENGKNVTPADCKAPVCKNLEVLCDEHLLEVINLYKIKIVIGIGAYAEKRLEKVLKNQNDVNILRLKHPSPIAGSEAKWITEADTFLSENNLNIYFH